MTSKITHSLITPKWLGQAESSLQDPRPLFPDTSLPYLAIPCALNYMSKTNLNTTPSSLFLPCTSLLVFPINTLFPNFVTTEVHYHLAFSHNPCLLNHLPNMKSQPVSLMTKILQWVSSQRSRMKIPFIIKPGYLLNERGPLHN